MPQRSPEWYAVRLGKLTASRAGDMLATIKSGEAAARRDLRTQLVVERLTDQSQDNGYINAEMERGITLEPAAIAAYELLTGQIVQSVGFCEHDTLPAGCSLDGYVGDFDTLVSIKCPKSTTHLRYLRGGAMPNEYFGQMLCECWITGARRYDFVSFDDRMPPELQVFRAQVQVSDTAVRDFQTKALAFLAEVDDELSAVRTIRNLSGQLAASL